MSFFFHYLFFFFFLGFLFLGFLIMVYRNRIDNFSFFKKNIVYIIIIFSLLFSWIFLVFEYSTIKTYFFLYYIFRDSSALWILCQKGFWLVLVFLFSFFIILLILFLFEKKRYIFFFFFIYIMFISFLFFIYFFKYEYFVGLPIAIYMLEGEAIFSKDVFWWLSYAYLTYFVRIQTIFPMTEFRLAMGDLIDQIVTDRNYYLLWYLFDVMILLNFVFLFFCFRYLFFCLKHLFFIFLSYLHNEYDFFNFLKIIFKVNNFKDCFYLFLFFFNLFLYLFIFFVLIFYSFFLFTADFFILIIILFFIFFIVIPIFYILFLKDIGRRKRFIAVLYYSFFFIIFFIIFFSIVFLVSFCNHSNQMIDLKDIDIIKQQRGDLFNSVSTVFVFPWDDRLFKLMSSFAEKTNHSRWFKKFFFFDSRGKVHFFRIKPFFLFTLSLIDMPFFSICIFRFYDEDTGKIKDKFFFGVNLGYFFFLILKFFKKFFKDSILLKLIKWLFSIFFKK